MGRSSPITFTAAASSLSMDQALRNLVDTLGLDLRDASRRVSTFAADHLGLKDRGRLFNRLLAPVIAIANQNAGF